ncbi:MAG: zf-TFIIB domain-containing protein [Polyangiaceae bacterium]
MNLPSAALCTGCGYELGLEPLGTPDGLSCPDCRQHFQLFSGDGGLLRDCEHCGGQFVEHALLKALLERREAYGSHAPRPPRFNPLDNPVRYVACPVCRDVMSRRNFGRNSGVIVDVCARHGTWFDAGELPRVLAFVEAGGLDFARRREAEERRQRQNDERVRRVERSLAPLSGPGTTPQMFKTRAAADLSEAGGLLLDFVSTLLR